MILQRVQILPRPRDEVFAFFEDARNLEAITPPFLRFRVVTPGPIAMRAGALIEYRLSLFGAPFGWQTEIEIYEPTRRFVDRQLRGPFRVWRHTHEFEDVAGGTRMTDHVEYELPLGPLGDIAHALFVKRTVAKIFDYRAEVIGAHLEVAQKK